MECSPRPVWLVVLRTVPTTIQFQFPQCVRVAVGTASRAERGHECLRMLGQTEWVLGPRSHVHTVNV